MTSHELFNFQPDYPKRAPEDFLPELHHATSENQVPKPEEGREADKFDVIYFGVNPNDPQTGHYYYGHHEETGVIVPFGTEPSQSLSYRVSATAATRALQYGTSDPRIRREVKNGESYMTQADGYTLVAFSVSDSNISRRTGDSSTFIAKGGFEPGNQESESAAYENVMQKARTAFPSIFALLEGKSGGRAVEIHQAEDGFTFAINDQDLPKKVKTFSDLISGLTPEQVAEKLAQIDPIKLKVMRTDESSSAEAHVRERVSDILERINLSVKLTATERTAAEQAFDLDEATKQAIEAQQWGIENTLYRTQLAPDAKEVIERKAAELVQAPDRRKWLEDRFLHSEQITYELKDPAAREQLPKKAEAIESSESITTPGRVKAIGGRLAALISRGESKNEESEVTGRQGMFARAKQALQGKIGSIMAGILSGPNNIAESTEALPVNEQHHAEPDPNERGSRRRKVLMSVGVVAVGVATGLIAYRYGGFSLPGRSVVEGMAVPADLDLSSVPSESVHIDPRDVPLPDGGIPDAPETMNPVKTFQLAEGQSIWEYVQTQLPPNASNTEIYHETVRIMEANDLPTDLPGDDPLAAARQVRYGVDLVDPGRKA